MKTLIAGSHGMASVVPARGGGIRDWQRWAPYAAVAWSLIYAALGISWAVSGRGFQVDTGRPWGRTIGAGGVGGGICRDIPCRTPRTPSCTERGPARRSR